MKIIITKAPQVQGQEVFYHISFERKDDVVSIALTHSELQTLKADIERIINE